MHAQRDESGSRRERIANMEKDAKPFAILKQHGLTARDMLSRFRR
jgi:hypothetical protein